MSRFIQRIRRLIANLYYRYLFGRESSLEARMRLVVSTWEDMNRGGGITDTPAEAEAWEASYSSERWDYMRGLPELARYSILVGYISFLRPGASILDVGCGDGVLFDRIGPTGYSKYERAGYLREGDLRTDGTGRSEYGLHHRRHRVV